MPSPRYWCSESQAACAISERIRGVVPKKEPYPERKRLYDSIYEKYKELRKSRPNDSLAMIAFDIVNSHAPESFLSPDSAKVILNRHKNKLRIRTQQKQNSNNNETSISDIEHSADSDDGDTDRGKVVVRNQESGRCIGHQETDISSTSRELATHRSQPLHTSVSCVPIKRKDVAIHRIVYGSDEYTKLYNKRYTNVRFIRSQLCIDWGCHC